MAPDPKIMKAVEQLGYRVTVGDVSTQAGLNINLAQQGLLALASDAGGHLQVAESGEIAYLFPKNFRSVLRNKFLRLQLQEWWDKIWGVLFYLIRISFGIILLLSIVLIVIAITIILRASSDDDSGGGGSSSRGGGGGIFFFPRFWGPDIFWFFDPYYDGSSSRRQRTSSASDTSELNFLEAVFSFLFGDGNPNADLEERRWQEIGTVIRNSGGAVAAEQIAPYLDELGEKYQQESEDYMLPVLTRFDGLPQVSPEGQIVYHFPQLQTTAKAAQPKSVQAYLRERLWRFSQASSGQLMLSMGLGALNFIGVLILGNLLSGGEIAAQIGGLVAFVNVIYPLLLGYGIGFLVIPLIRYFWIQWKNSKIERRNQKRQEQAVMLNQAEDSLQQKISYAQQFAVQNIIKEEDLVYTSETDLLDQELKAKEQIDAEWQRRLESGS
ncbi:MAG: hypothetical protein F6K31_43620 [Symploca sp. SIO2G7]|nr:hypothetical protein [Symploca sp. SIO2G7]